MKHTFKELSPGSSVLLVSPDKVVEIPVDERIDNDKPLEEQVDPDPQFWESYQVARPSRLSY